MTDNTIDFTNLDKKLQDQESSDAGMLAKDKLSKRGRKTARRIIIRSLYILLPGIAIGLMLLGSFIYYAWDDRASGDEFLYGTCYVDVGGTRVVGKRQFIRPFTDLLGMRYINPNLLSEKLIMDNEHYGLVVVSMTLPDESSVTIMKPEMGAHVEVPLGDKYIFIFDDQSEVVNHSDLCF